MRDFNYKMQHMRNFNCKNQGKEPGRPQKKCQKNHCQLNFAPVSKCVNEQTSESTSKQLRERMEKTHAQTSKIK